MSLMSNLYFNMQLHSPASCRNRFTCMRDIFFNLFPVRSLSFSSAGSRLCCMFRSADVKPCSTGFLPVLGVLTNIFNLLVQQWRSGGVKTVALIICFISLGNVPLQSSTFVLAAPVWDRSALRASICRSSSASSCLCGSAAALLASGLSPWLDVLYCVRVLSFSSVLFMSDEGEHPRPS